MHWNRSCLRSDLFNLSLRSSGGALALALTLAGCGDGKSDNTSDSATTPTGASANTSSGDSVSASAETGDSGSSVGTTAGSGEGSTSGVATGGTTCEFICDPDGGGDQMCDVFAQDCPEGEKCAAYDADGDNSWDATKCVEAMGTGQHGDECTMEGLTGVDDCAAGVMCWNQDPDTGFGICVELCTGSMESPSCGPPDTFCTIVNNGTLNLCLDSCDPLVQNCMGDDLCLPNPDGQGFVCALNASGGMGFEDVPCGFANSCNPGLFCMAASVLPVCDAEFCCSPVCDLTTMDECIGDKECVPWFNEGQEPPGLEAVGICILPQ